MNKFPKWWNSTVTIYNRYEDPKTQKITWYRTVVTGCFWDSGIADVHLMSNYVITRADSPLCRIPKQNIYVNAYKWKQLSDEQRNNLFTLQMGDVIVNAEIDDVIDEYNKGKRLSDLIEKYKDLGVLKITGVADNSDETRNLPHYLVV